MMSEIELLLCTMYTFGSKCQQYYLCWTLWIIFYTFWLERSGHTETKPFNIMGISQQKGDLSR